jgi:hypothetical protein
MSMRSAHLAVEINPSRDRRCCDSATVSAWEPLSREVER